MGKDYNNAKALKQNTKEKAIYTYHSPKGGVLYVYSNYIVWEPEESTESRKLFLMESIHSTNVLGVALVSIISKKHEVIRFEANSSSDAYNICRLLDKKRKEIEKEDYKNSPASTKEDIITIKKKIKVLVVLLIGVAIFSLLMIIGSCFADEDFTLCGIGLIGYFILNIIVGFLAGKLGGAQSRIDGSYDNWTSNDKGCVENGVTGCAGTGCIGACSYVIYLFYGLAGWIFAIVKIVNLKQSLNNISNKESVDK